MKRKYFGWSFLIVFLPLLAQADPVPAPASIGFGIKGGVSYSIQNYSPNGLEPNTGLPFAGPTAGVFSDVHLLDFLSVQLEANYVQKGANGYNALTTGIASYDYLEIPFLLRVQTKFARDWTGYLLAGPSVSFLLNETTKTFYSGSEIIVNNTSAYPSTDCDICFGIGIEYRNFIFEIRSGWGLNGNDSESFRDGITTTNEFSSIQLGYRLF